MHRMTSEGLRGVSTSNMCGAAGQLNARCCTGNKRSHRRIQTESIGLDRAPGRLWLCSSSFGRNYKSTVTNVATTTSTRTPRRSNVNNQRKRYEPNVHFSREDTRMDTHVIVTGHRCSRVVCRGKIDTKERWWEKDTDIDNVKTVYNTENFLYQLSQNQDKLVIVDFFATWCGSCRALYPKLIQMAEENESIVLLKVNFDENKQMSKSLGVKVLPYFMLYRGALGKVAQFSASISKIQRLRSAIAEHSSPFCSIGPVPDIPELEVKKTEQQVASREEVADDDGSGFS